MFGGDQVRLRVVVDEHIKSPVGTDQARAGVMESTRYFGTSVVACRFMAE